MRLFHFYLPLILLLIITCKPTKSTTGSNKGSNRYSEDLSYLRPKVEGKTDTLTTTASLPKEGKKPNALVTPKFNINQQLDAVLDSIDKANLSRNAIDGFIIQVYSGLDREEALKTRKELMNTIPDIDSEVQYKQPNFLVKAGEYFSRLDAQKDFVNIKRYFPHAIIIPEKINIHD